MDQKNMISEDSEDSSPKNGSTCLNCSKQNKRCDSKRPCTFCSQKQLQCVENDNRKPAGKSKRKAEEQEKKSKDINQKKAKKEQEMKIAEFRSTEKIFCESCKAPQSITANFCNQCGSILNHKHKEVEMEDLFKEIEVLKRKNEEMQRMVEMKDLLLLKLMNQEITSQVSLWMIVKFVFPNNTNVPTKVPSFILDCSPSFLNLLGYDSLFNSYYTDLIPSRFSCGIFGDNFCIKINRMEGIITPKLCFKDNLFIRTSSGKHLHLSVNTSMFFDSFNKLPSFRIITVDRICNLDVDIDSVPYQQYSSNFIFHTNTVEDIPPIIRKFICKHQTTNNVAPKGDQGLSNTSFAKNEKNLL